MPSSISARARALFAGATAAVALGAIACDDTTEKGGMRSSPADAGPLDPQGPDGPQGPGGPQGPDPGKPDLDPPVTSASPVDDRIRQGKVTVTLTASEPGTTYYTLDGTAPTSSSPRYVRPLVIDRTRTLRFFSVDAAGNAEAAKSQRYRVDVVRRLLLDIAL